MNTLTRTHHGRPAAPTRIVHLGLGNFTRAHQAWYTEHASDAEEWGIAAFTGRRPTMAEALAPQDGLYTLITKEADGDRFEVISSLSAVHPADDFPALISYFTSSQLAICTTTVTEAGYCRADDGSLDCTVGDVARDLEALRALLADGAPSPEEVAAQRPRTAPTRIVAALLARRSAGLGAMTILPCDNLPDNGEAFRRVIRAGAAAVDPSLVEWIDEHIAFATCMVDRITPATTAREVAAVEAQQGYHDASPVPTEPFSEWVISGEFPAGRPDWVSAGAQIVDDVEPYEQRKLWMLNGSHSLMAYAGPILGLETVRDGINDPRLRRLVEQWWREAGPGLSVPWEDYAAALTERYDNPNIRHLLAQIAADGSQKIPVRIIPTLRAWRARGEMPEAGVTAVAAWLLHLRGHGAPVKDAAADKVQALVGGSLEQDAAKVIAFAAPDLADDSELVVAVARAADALLA